MQRGNLKAVGSERFWWRRRELNSDPKAVAGALYMLSRFSFRKDPKAVAVFALRKVCETTRPLQELVRLCLARFNGPKKRASSTV